MIRHDDDDNDDDDCTDKGRVDNNYNDAEEDGNTTVVSLVQMFANYKMVPKRNFGIIYLVHSSHMHF